jgi:hypothetical protein
MMYFFIEQKYLEGLPKKPVVKAPAPPKVATTDIEKMTLKELQQKCRDKGLKGYSGKKKADLIEMLKGKAPSKSAKSNAKKSSPKKTTKKTSPKKTTKTSPSKKTTTSTKKSSPPKKTTKKASTTTAKKTSTSTKASTSKKSLPAKKTLSAMTVKELQAYSKAKGIKGYSGKKKEDLIKYIKAHK